MIDNGTGFSLVENLAALAVLSLGLLGVAALTTHALGAIRVGVHRQTAILLVDDAESRLLGTGRTDEQTPDLEDWHDEVARRLPSGRGAISREKRAGVDSISIVVNWSEPSIGAQQHTAVVAIAR